MEGLHYEREQGKCYLQYPLLKSLRCLSDNKCLAAMIVMKFKLRLKGKELMEDCNQGLQDFIIGGIILDPESINDRDERMSRTMFGKKRGFVTTKD